MLKGKGVSSGIGLGNVVVLKKQKEMQIKNNRNEQIEHELERLHMALNEVAGETEAQLKTLVVQKQI